MASLLWPLKKNLFSGTFEVGVCSNQKMLGQISNFLVNNFYQNVTQDLSSSDQDLPQDLPSLGQLLN